MGHADDAAGRRRAVLWRDDRIIDLGTLGGDDAGAVAVNDAGQVVGVATSAPGQEIGESGSRAFLWEAGRMTDLGTLGGDSSWAVAINDAGRVVGTAETAAGATHAFRWEDGHMTDLGTLGGDRSDAYAINEAGQIVGMADIVPGLDLDDGWHAFFWQDGRMEALGTAGAMWTAAWGVNDRGEVVGEAINTVALLWRGEQATELAALIPPESGWDLLHIARAINARGQIVGWGQRDGATRAFLVTPRSAHATPIPGAPVPSVSIEPPLRFADTA